MKNLLLTITVLSFISCGGQNETETEKWYAGGTLHNSTLATWQNAEEKDKLATCADFVANAKDYQGDMDQMKNDASEVMKCIDEIAKESNLSSEKTAEMAATCVVSMGIDK
jgi:hypothetical protein